MAAAPPFDLNLVETPSWGARSVECFEKLDQIGEGTYGQVYMAREKVTGEIVALKKVRMDNEKEGFPITAIREIKILKKLNHENVIKLKEIVTSKATDSNKYKGHIYMVFEYMDHDLTGLADRPGMRFTIPQIKCYMQQLLKGLHYCHLNQVLHRDIKGSNLLIDNNGVLKLADFGLARSFSSENNCPLTNRVITLWYRPPELLLGATKYGPAVDMWSVGCIFAELLSGRPILPGKNELEQLQLIFQLCGTPDESNWEDVTKLPLYSLIKNEKPHPRQLHINFKNFHPSALKLVEKLLTLDPKKRLSAKDALDSDYFWTDPMPCDPGSLPKYEPSHEFQTKKRRQAARQQMEDAKRQKQQQGRALHQQQQPSHQQQHSQKRQNPSSLAPPGPPALHYPGGGGGTSGQGQWHQQQGNRPPQQGQQVGYARSAYAGAYGGGAGTAPGAGNIVRGSYAVPGNYGAAVPYGGIAGRAPGHPSSAGRGLPYGPAVGPSAPSQAQGSGYPQGRAYIQQSAQYVDIDGAYARAAHSTYPTHHQNMSPPRDYRQQPRQ